MIEKTITVNEAGQRLDKFLHKYLPEAGNGFLYKMLRKKNITLNGKKAEGKEKLAFGDTLRFFLSEETIAGFQGNREAIRDYAEAFLRLEGVRILYEGEHILIADKPVGVLSQKAAPSDLSLNEWLIGYLLKQGKITIGELDTFRPSVCNRLDRNTSGMVICARTLAGSQEISRMLKKREIHKYYRLYVKGRVEKAGEIKSYLDKDTGSNQVHIRLLHETEAANPRQDGGKCEAVTRYEPVRLWSDRTLLEAQLITGKTHQIRAHLAAVGHPLIGDYKYGDRKLNDIYKKQCQVESQLLHACRLVFPSMEGILGEMSGLTVTSEPPEVFRKMEEGS